MCIVTELGFKSIQRYCSVYYEYYAVYTLVVLGNKCNGEDIGGGVSLRIYFSGLSLSLSLSFCWSGHVFS